MLRDEYGVYEQVEGGRRYLQVKSERAERRVPNRYPQHLTRNSRNFLGLRPLREQLEGKDSIGDCMEHLDDALDMNLPFHIRRQHFDCLFTELVECGLKELANEHLR